MDPEGASETGVTVVIPAHDEAPRVGAVVAAARAAPSVARVVVVSDGSRDGTPAAARSAGAEVIVLGRRCGKGDALAAGVAAAGADHVCLLDADLTGLAPAHVEALVEPVVAGRAMMAIGQVDRQPAAMVPWISGQRSLSAQVVPYVPGALYGRGWAAEIALTRLVQGRGGRIELVRLAGVYHVPKWRKRPILAAAGGMWATYRELAGAMTTGYAV